LHASACYVYNLLDKSPALLCNIKDLSLKAESAIHGLVAIICAWSLLCVKKANFAGLESLSDTAGIGKHGAGRTTSCSCTASVWHD